MSAYVRMSLCVIAAASGCVSPSDEDPTDGSDAPTDVAGGTDATDSPKTTDVTDATDATEVTDVTDEPVTRRTLTGYASWAVDFRKDSVADCSYTRNYLGTEDLSTPWVCSEGCASFVSNVTVDGLECRALAFGSPLFSATEVVGLAESGFWRMNPDSSVYNGPAATVGTGVDVEDTFEQDTSVGRATITMSGHFEYGEEAGEPGQLASALSYTCGWPRPNPPQYTGGYGELALGDTLPDGVFLDHCDEGVRLHDFQGTYVMLVFGATDCGPCQVEAPELAELEEWAISEGYGVTVVTLLASKLSATALSPNRSELEAWRTGFGLTGPVLADRGYGGTLLTRNFGDDYAYPGFLLFAPDLTMVGSQSGSYRAVANAKDLIRAHAAAQP
jgi:hypothetical protein